MQKRFDEDDTDVPLDFFEKEKQKMRLCCLNYRKKIEKEVFSHKIRTRIIINMSSQNFLDIQRFRSSRSNSRKYPGSTLQIHTFRSKRQHNSSKVSVIIMEDSVYFSLYFTQLRKVILSKNYGMTSLWILTLRSG